MKFCSQIVTYNEENLIRGCLSGLKDIFNIVGISKPWMGTHTYFDKSEEYAREMGAYVLKQDFRTEHEQRTAISKLAKEMGYDYVLIIDADEFYTREDIQKIIKKIEETRSEVYKIATEVLFWKNENWETIPRIKNARVGAVKAGLDFRLTRNPNSNSEINYFPVDAIMYHFSYAGSDEHIYSKISHFSHAAEMNPLWFEEVYKKWTPEMENLHPSVGASHYFKKAIPVECPEEIKLRFRMNNKINI